MARIILAAGMSDILEAPIAKWFALNINIFQGFICLNLFL